MKLFFVNTDVLVERYNQCLEALGMEATQLKSFHIDLSGWSPEIAEEKDNPRYLRHGSANIYGIILSYEQQQCDSSRDLYAFLPAVMQEWYVKYEREIKDTSTVSGVIIDFDNGISRFTDPTDLLLLHYIKVGSFTPDKIEKAFSFQQELFVKLKSEEYAWMDPNLHQQAIESGKKYGDLRRKYLLIPELSFTCLDSFYTELFGGCFVFHCIDEKPVLILKNKKQYKSISDSSECIAFHLSDTKTLKFLFKKGLFTHSIDSTDLSVLLEMILMDHLFKSDDDLDYKELTDFEKRNWLMKNEADIDPLYFDVERYIAFLNKGGDSSDFDYSESLTQLLATIHSGFPSELQNTLQLLLTFLQPYDVLSQFQYNRYVFEQELKQKPLCQQESLNKFVQQQIGVES